MTSFIAGALTTVLSSYITYIIAHNKNVEDKIINSMAKHNVAEILDYFDKDNFSKKDIESLNAFYSDLNEFDIYFKSFNCFEKYTNTRNRLLFLTRHCLSSFNREMLIFKDKDFIGYNEELGTPEVRADNIICLLRDLVNFDCRKSFLYRRNLNRFKGNDVDIKLEKFFEQY